ncbi:hypothetical protein VTO73DRAFT_14470 [Trametes versicolor]
MAKLIQQQLDKLRDGLNNHKPRRDNLKLNPTGVAPNIAYALFQEHGGDQCMQAVDAHVVTELMEALGGEDIIGFVSVEYEMRAQKVFDDLGISQLEGERR